MEQSFHKNKINPYLQQALTLTDGGKVEENTIRQGARDDFGSENPHKFWCAEVEGTPEDNRKTVSCQASPWHDHDFYDHEHRAEEPFWLPKDTSDADRMSGFDRVDHGGSENAILSRYILTHLPVMGRNVMLIW